MSTELLSNLALFVLGVVVAVLGLCCLALLKRMRALEAKLEDITPRRYIQGAHPSQVIFDEATGTGAGLIDEIKAAVQRLPKGRGLS